MNRLHLCLLAASLAAALAQPAMGAPAAALGAETVNAAGKLNASAGKANSRKASAGKADGAALLRAQILLERAHFSPGEIDAASGSNMRQALAGYQKVKGLAVSGALDGATWDALNSDAADVLIGYTISEADVAGPYQAIPDDMAEKAKLPALGFATVDEALGEKFHASPALLKRLNPGKDFKRAGEQIIVPNVQEAEALPKGASIVVDRSDRTLTLLDAAGTVLAQFPASTGSEHDPLPVGNWKVKGISKNPVFHYNPKLFWDANPGEKQAKIPAGPNNPVGVAWIDLSKPHYGIHGTPTPSSIGKTESHGCIRLTNWSVAALIQSVGSGTDVILQD